MFHPATTQKRIEQLAKKGVIVKRLPIDYRMSMRARLEDNRFIYDKKGIWRESTETGELVFVRSYTAEEVEFMRNERILCRLDFRYWVNNYVWIKSREDKIIQMEVWNSQEIFLDIVAEMESWQIAILLIILKARQLGISRIVSLIVLHAVIFFPNINSFMASSTDDKTEKLFDMVEIVYKRLPWWMRPKERYNRSNKLLEFENNSAITLQYGAQTSGIARGTTPTVFHLTEVAEFEKVGIRDPSLIIDSSLLRAVHDSPVVKGFLEGTAEGENNYWNDKWTSAKSGWPTRRSRLRPLFLPWFVGGLYPQSDWLRGHPVPADYSSEMLPWAKAHAEMAQAYVQQTDYLSKRLGSGWHMSLEQIWYYECSREEAIREHKLNKFYQEMPANDDEAFQSTNISVFDTETIVYYREYAHRQPIMDPDRPTIGAYGLVGPEDWVPARFQPSDLSIDHEGIINGYRKPIEVKFQSTTGYPIPFKFVPMKFNGWSMEADAEYGSVDKIFFWEEPEDGEIYSFGVDTSDGIGKDRTVLEGIRKGNVHRPARQMVEFASSKMTATEAMPFCLAIGSYFTVLDPYSLEKKQPRMAIECRGNGDNTQNFMRMAGWTNFHPWIDRQIDDKQLKLNRFHKIGVFTNGPFRAGMMDMMITMIRNCDIEVCSPFLVNEMKSLEGDEFEQSLRAVYGGHDDRFMALGFAIVSVYRFDKNHANKTAPEIAAYNGRTTKARGPRRYATFTPGVQSAPANIVGTDKSDLNRMQAFMDSWEKSSLNW